MPAASYPPNPKLRAARQQRNWTLSDAARELRTLMVSRGEAQACVSLYHVSRWERGERRPGMRHRHYLCMLYGLQPDQLGFLPSDYAEPDLATRTGQASSWEDNGRATQPGCSGDELELLNLTRRKLLAASGLLAAAVGAETAAEAATKLAEPLDRAARVASGRAAADAELVAGLKGFIDGFERSLVQVSGDLLIEPLGAHIEMMKTVLKQSLLPDQRVELLRIASQASALMGWLQLFDRNDRATARRWVAECIEFGEATADPNTYIMGVGRAAELSTYSGQGARSLQLLEPAQKLAERAGTPNVLSWVLATKAEAHATLNQPKDAVRLLDLATDAQQRSVPEYEPSWAESWGPANIAGYTGAVYMRLEQPGRARKPLHAALAVAEPSAVKLRSVYLVDLATTYAQEFEVEAACELAGKALDLAGPMHYGNTLERMAGLRQRLARMPRVPAVRDLDERLRAARST